MKPNKLTTLILISAAVIVSATVLVYNLINPRNQRLEKPVAPAAVKTYVKPKVAVPVEPYIQLPKYVKPKRVSKSLPKTAKASAIPAGAKGAVAAVKASVPVRAAEKYSAGSFQNEPYAGGVRSLQNEMARYEKSKGFKAAMPGDNYPVLNEAEKVRHEQLRNGIVSYVRVPITPQQIERMNAQIAETLPKNYSEILTNLEAYKQQQKAEMQSKSQIQASMPMQGADVDGEASESVQIQPMDSSIYKFKTAEHK